MLANNLFIQTQLYFILVTNFIFAQMGNKPPKIQANIQEHERLGLIKFLEPPINQEELQKIQVQRPVTNEKAYNQWLENLRKFDNELTRQLFYLPQKFKFQPTGLCGNSGIVHIEFQYFPFLLKNQIRNRRNLNQYFQETEIWYLVYKMVQAEAVFEKLGTKVGDFNPRSILLNQNGEIRIISSFSLPNQIDNFTKITQHILAEVYLAPQQIDMQSIQKARYPDHVDPNKAELFCIGITLMQAATLEDCNFFFTRNPLKLQLQKLQKLKNIVANKYSGFLCQVLRQMTQIDPKKRRTAQNLVEILKPYENMILDLQSVNWSHIQHSSVKSSAFFNDGTGPRNKGPQIENFSKKNY